MQLIMLGEDNSYSITLGYTVMVHGASDLFSWFGHDTTYTVAGLM